PGNPILYGVTNKFYDYFKLKSTYELPKLTEFNYSDGTENEARDFNLFDGIKVDVE
ncbi:SMC-Scp complex subunit ScpB, partial [Mycoplasmopsis bovis]